MEIAVNTDYVQGTGNPQPFLKCIAEAGFTHLHWCHQWCTDFIYDDCEIEQIKKWLQEYNLTLLDIHGSIGTEKCWYSLVEYERQAGVAMVANRLKMHSKLGGTGTVMMHVPAITARTKPEDVPVVWQKVNALKKSIQELTPLIHSLHVPLAIENTFVDTFEVIENILNAFPPEIVGLCYDSGHGNLGDCHGLEHLDKNKNRLQALHIHDNNHLSDQHQPPFMGTLDWEKFASILAASPYNRQISFEISMRNTIYKDKNVFMADAYKRCRKFTEMVYERKAK